MNDPTHVQTLITQQERQQVLQRLTLQHPDLASKIENQVYNESAGIKTTYFQRLKKLTDHLQALHQQRMLEAMTKKTTNGFASQPKPMLNQLLTQPVVQLSTNLQQIRSLNSQSTSLPPQMSPFNPAARHREPTLDAPAQPMFSPMQTRPRPVATNTNNDVLHRFVVGNPQPQPATPSSSGDRLLQQILLSSPDAFASNRQFVPQPSAPPVAPRPQPTPALTGPILNPDEDTLNLIKVLRDSTPRFRVQLEKLHNEGNETRKRDLHNLYQQVVQFITNPSYEQLANARKIRLMLQRTPQPQPQPQPQPAPPPPAQPPAPVAPPPCDLNQFGKHFGEFLSSDGRKRSLMSKFIIEPLTDVLNGVPHKKIRLDVENSPPFKSIAKRNSSFVSRLDNELKEIPRGIFFIERMSAERTDDAYLRKNGLTLRCQLIGADFPLVPSLNLRISTDYPDEEPEILSLTKTTPPKLQFTDDHPLLEEISNYFVSHLFKLQRQHRITDLLYIWRDSVESVL